MMGQVYRAPSNGIRTPVGTDPYRWGDSLNRSRYSNWAGVGSVGLKDGKGASTIASMQFGTNATDPIPSTAYTVTATNQEGGSAPQLIETDGDGNQSAGYGRYRWTKATKQLDLIVKAGDALISGKARVQAYNYRLMHQTVYWRQYFAFTLGTVDAPWVPLEPTPSALDGCIIMQIVSDSAGPVLSIAAVSPTSGNANHRNIVLGTKDAPGDPGDPTTTIARIENVEVGYDKPHYAILDFCLDHRTVAEGGQPYVAFNFDGAQIPLLVTPTITAYPTDSSVQRPMIGQYWYARSSALAADSGLGVLCYRHETFMTPPCENTLGTAVFDLPGDRLTGYVR